MELLIASLAFASLGIFAGWFLSRSKKGPTREDLQKLEVDNNSLSVRLSSLSDELKRTSEKKEEYAQRIIALEKEQSALETERKGLEERISSHQKEIASLQERFRIEFENLANKIFETHTDRFKKDSEEKIGTLLSPLTDELSKFRKTVDEKYNTEANERFSLKNEIIKIVEANAMISQDAKNLTLALKGDPQAQGAWGEFVLEKILEASGLREGEEYTAQGRDLKLVDEEGKRLRPDIIINLPDNKHVVIDSKVSLVHYERYTSAQEPKEKETCLKNMLGSVYAHIDGLSDKKYDHLEKLITPDFVLMFMPLEGAFSLAVQNDKGLFPYAWEKRIIIVSPATLLATLRTVSSIWKHERQNKNAMLIAQRGGQLYDKFVLLLEDLKDIELNFEKTTKLFGDVKNKLKDGKGNLISQVDKIKRLGAKTSKEIPQDFMASENTDNNGGEK